MVTIPWRATSTFQYGPITAPTQTLAYVTFGTVPGSLGLSDYSAVICMLGACYTDCYPFNAPRFVCADSTIVTDTVFLGAMGTPGMGVALGAIPQAYGSWSAWSFSVGNHPSIRLGGTIQGPYYYGGGVGSVLDCGGAVMFVYDMGLNNFYPTYTWNSRFGPHGSVGTGPPLYDTAVSALYQAIFSCGGSNTAPAMTDPSPQPMLSFHGRKDTSSGWSINAGGGWMDIGYVSVPDAFVGLLGGNQYPQPTPQGPITMAIAMYVGSGGFNIPGQWLSGGASASTWDSGLQTVISPVAVPKRGGRAFTTVSANQFYIPNANNIAATAVSASEFLTPAMYNVAAISVQACEFWPGLPTSSQVIG